MKEYTEKEIDQLKKISTSNLGCAWRSAKNDCSDCVALKKCVNTNSSIDMNKWATKELSKIKGDKA